MEDRDADECEDVVSAESLCGVVTAMIGMTRVVN